MRPLQQIAFALLALTALHKPAPAQDYPNRSITLMVPLAPGGGMDFIARTIGAKLSERIGKPVLVENRPGGGTIVATVALAKAPPDGYTLLLVPAPTLTTNAVVYKTLPYDPRNDFAPIALTSQVAFALVVNPALPIHSVADLIKYAKQRPGELIAGTSGVAGVPHLAAELLAHKTGIKIRSVHYRGSPPALTKWSSAATTSRRKSPKIFVIETWSYRSVGIKQPAVLVECESVGHAGQVIGDDSGLAGEAGGGRGTPFLGQAFGFGEQ